MKRKRLLFIQLPQLDNDPRGGLENEKLAAVYLRHALERAGEDRHYEPVLAPVRTDRLDNRHFLQYLLDGKPDVVAATLYAWNVERTIRLLREARGRLPALRLAVGGPEVARRHPFLFAAGVADVAVAGEGEPVFPAILRAFRGGPVPDFASVAWHTGHGYRWGHGRPEPETLAQMLPPSGYPLVRPNAAGIGYLETTRGCPMRCAFCCYNQRRRGVTSLSVPDVIRRIQTLRRRGAREIRFIDPTFNAHPRFDELIAAIADANGDRRLAFFAELRADTLTARQAERLAHANFREIEIGIQSSDPAVLRTIRRPLPGARVWPGIRALAGRRVRLTLDVMCGLPGQTLGDVKHTLRLAAGFPRTHVQLLHTLLLPGTELRHRRRRLGLWAMSAPPYRVERTATMSPDQLREADEYAVRLLRRRLDCPARRFVGRQLPDLFAEQVTVNLDRRRCGPDPVDPPGNSAPNLIPPGRANRRALIFKGRDLYARRARICRWIQAAIRQDPDALWQFVLQPTDEEPLDLLDAMTAAIDVFPPHFVDRNLVRREGTRRVSRRIFVRLPGGRRHSRSWILAAEDCLAVNYY